ncbi:EB module [Oesophagostomum dentatum]|uniref:EB module n=1 Tax=Oesophagostomum dentatum TaxID=61180 RepID=A0A0B1STZ8_OESDE|nr:EB module [Oesophagostomum dentatum]
MEIWIFRWLLALSLSSSITLTYGAASNPPPPDEYKEDLGTKEDPSMDPWTALASAVNSMIYKRLCDKTVSGAKCDQNGRCICPGIQNVYYRKLERFVSLNETAPNAQRRTAEKFSKISNGRTDYALRPSISGIPPAMQNERTCPLGQTFVSEAGACMTTQLPGEPCQYSQQCAAAEPGAFCLRLRCQCTYGMRENNGGCSFIDSECNERGLVFIPEIGECRSVLRPGSLGCSHNLQCSQAFADAKCIQQTCTCPDNLPVAVEGTCAPRCSAGEVYSSTAGQCIPAVTPAGLCLYTSQCQAIEHGMTCEKNSCRCPNGLIKQITLAPFQVFSGSQCTQSCPIGYVVDSRGVCTRDRTT